MSRFSLCCSFCLSSKIPNLFRNFVKFAFKNLYPRRCAVSSIPSHLISFHPKLIFFLNDVITWRLSCYIAIPLISRLLSLFQGRACATVSPHARPIISTTINNKTSGALSHLPISNKFNIKIIWLLPINNSV